MSLPFYPLEYNSAHSLSRAVNRVCCSCSQVRSQIINRLQWMEWMRKLPECWLPPVQTWIGKYPHQTREFCNLCVPHSCSCFSYCSPYSFLQKLEFPFAFCCLPKWWPQKSQDSWAHDCGRSWREFFLFVSLTNFPVFVIFYWRWRLSCSSTDMAIYSSIQCSCAPSWKRGCSEDQHCLMFLNCSSQLERTSMLCPKREYSSASCWQATHSSRNNLNSLVDVVWHTCLQ